MVFRNHLLYSLVPRPSIHSFFDPLQCANTASVCLISMGGRIGILSRDLQLDCHVSSHLPSIAKWHTRPILHSALATKMGHVPAESYTECMKPTQVKSCDSKWLLSDMHENIQQWRSHPLGWKDSTVCSCTAYSLVWFSSFSVAGDKNMNLWCQPCCGSCDKIPQAFSFHFYIMQVISCKVWYGVWLAAIIICMRSL